MSIYCNTFTANERAAIIGIAGIVITYLLNLTVRFSETQFTKKRVQMAIRSDIRSIVLALELTGVVRDFVNVFQKPDAQNLPSWSDAPRQEDYFKLYESLAPQIGILDGHLTKEAVKFYTFLKVSRDAAAPFGSFRKRKFSEHDIRESANNVLSALYQALDAARIVLDKKFSNTKSKDEGLAEVIKLQKIIVDASVVVATHKASPTRG